MKTWVLIILFSTGGFAVVDDLSRKECYQSLNVLQYLSDNKSIAFCQKKKAT